MAKDQTTTSATEPSTLNIPEEVQKKFPDLVELIKGSQSMNDEERQYWVDVLSIMTDEQITNLRNILENEKKQIEEANQEYEESVQKEVKKSQLDFDEVKYKEKKHIRIKAETKHEEEEKAHEAAILEELEKL